MASIASSIATRAIAVARTPHGATMTHGPYKVIYMRKWLRAYGVFCSILATSILASSIPASAQKDSPLAIAHVTVIDCTGAPPKPNSTVVIAEGRITAVGPSDRVSIPAGVHVVDGNGKFLIPGLWDMHGHLTDATEDAFPLLIMNGVTGVRDMGGNSHRSTAGARRLRAARV